MSKILLTCCRCNTKFEREIGEHNRSVRLGRPEYCGRSCVGLALNDRIDMSPELSKIRINNLKKGQDRKGRKRDEFTPFKGLLKSIKSRCKRKGMICSITVEDIKKLWDKQQGKCIYSGLKMNLPKDSGGFRGRPAIRNVSIDRIDLSKSYEKNNIVLCCYAANIGKGIWKTSEYINFCKIVCEYNLWKS